MGLKQHNQLNLIGKQLGKDDIEDGKDDIEDAPNVNKRRQKGKI